MADKVADEDKLTSTNYVRWKLVIRGKLMAKGVWRVVYIAVPRDGRDNDWIDMNFKALGIILCSIADTRLAYLVASVDVAREAWEMLEREHLTNKNTIELTLNSKLHSLEMGRSETGPSFVTRGAQILKELQAVGAETTERAVCFAIIRQLPSKYLQFFGSALLDTTMTIAKLSASMAQAEMLLGAGKEPKAASGVYHVGLGGLGGSGKGGNGGRGAGNADVRCNGCREVGHYKNKCPYALYPVDPQYPKGVGAPKVSASATMIASATVPTYQVLSAESDEGQIEGIEYGIIA